MACNSRPFSTAYLVLKSIRVLFRSPFFFLVLHSSKLVLPCVIFISTASALETFTTLQKIRELGGDKYNYASDYEIVAKLKAFSDKHNVCLLVVHHTRKMESEDSFDMISGTNGLLGAADGAFILQKKKRTDRSAKLSVVGRDQQDQELTLEFDQAHCLWKLVKSETEVWKTPPDPVLDSVAKLVTPLAPVWSGRPSELAAHLPDVSLLPHVLTR